MLTVLYYTIVGFSSGLCALLVFVGVGCTMRSKPADATDAPRVVQQPPPELPAPPLPAAKPNPPKVAAPPVVPDGPLAFDGLTNTLANDYANNADRADMRCKDKRVRVKGRIDHVGEREGLVVLGYSATRDGARPLEATVVFSFPKGATAAELGVRPGQIATIEGTCRGRVEDAAPRASGQTYHIRIDGCKLTATEIESR